MSHSTRPRQPDDLGKLLDLARSAPAEPTPGIRPGFAPGVVRIAREKLGATVTVRGLDGVAVATGSGLLRALPGSAAIRWAVLACLAATIAIALLSAPPRSGGSWMSPGAGAGAGFESHLSKLARFPGR